MMFCHLIHSTLPLPADSVWSTQRSSTSMLRVFRGLTRRSLGACGSWRKKDLSRLLPAFWWVFFSRRISLSPSVDCLYLDIHRCRFPYVCRSWFTRIQSRVWWVKQRVMIDPHTYETLGALLFDFLTYHFTFKETAQGHKRQKILLSAVHKKRERSKESAKFSVTKKY